MKIFTLFTKFLFLLFILLIAHGSEVFAQATTDPEPVPTILWKGTTSTDWGVASNWTPARLPIASDVVGIGTTEFTGSNHPIMNETAVVTLKSIVLSNESGKGTKLLITNNYNLVVTENLIIKAGATLENEGSDMVLQGSFINHGSYIESEFLKNNGRKGRFYPSIEMSGVKTATITPTIGGTVPLTISHLKITGSVTLAQNLLIRTRNIITSGQNTKPTSDLTIVGTFDPGLNKVTFVGKGASDTTPTDESNTFVVEAGGTLRVMAAAYDQNYAIQPHTMYTTSTVEYGATTTDQDIFPREYGILKISGKDKVKQLVGNTTVSNIDARTQLLVESGTLDLKTFSLNRTSGSTNVAGGTITVANDAFLKIDGTGTFPTGYQAVSLGSTSTVEYYGSAQTVATHTYGNLVLSGSGTKTMPATIFTVAGNFSSSGTVSYTAGNNFTVLGDVSIGSGTIFDGSSRTITVGGHWTNNGTFIPTTSTVIMNGAGKDILRTSGIVPFYHLSITTGQITAGVNVEVFGNLTTSGGGKFTSTADLTMSSATAMNITGESITLNNLIGNGVTNTIATIAVNGNLTVNPGKSFTATGGVINMQGANKHIINSGALQLYSLRILSAITTSSNFLVSNNLSGIGRLTASGGLITFNGNSTFGGTHRLFDVTVLNGQALTLNSNSDLGIANVLATTGTINVNVNTPNTITFNKDGAQDIPGRQYFNLVLANNGIKTALGSLIVAGDMTVRDTPAATTGFAAGSFVHTIESNLYNNAGAAFNAGTSTISFTGSGNSSVTGAATVFDVLQVNKAVTSSYLQLNNHIQAKDLIVGTAASAAGEIRTGSFVLTVTGNRTGLGWVYGTIKRERTSFASNTAYAFAGPYNTISLTDASGVTAVTVTNTSGIVSNFTNGNAINRRYEVSVTGGSNHAGIMKLQYNDGVELNANNETLVQFFQETVTGDSWEAKGVTSRSVTDNWVEYATLADVKGRWTLSESAGILRWVGSPTSNNWETASNWRVGSNTATQIPQSGDIVQFGGDDVLSQPNLTGATTVRAIQFLNSGQDMTLTLGANAKLTVNGNVAANGSGASTKAHEVKVDNTTALLTVGGSLVLSGGLTNNLKLTVNAGNVSVAGDINQSNLSSIALNAGTLTIGGDYNGAGLTAATGSTVNYNGTGSQIIAPVNYHHLTVSKTSGIATLTSTAALTIGGELSKTGNGTLALRTDDLTVNGNVTMAAGDLDAGNSTIKVGGNWTRTSGTFWPATSTVKFTGSTDAFIGVAGGAEADYTFNKLAFEKTGSAVFTVNRNIRINADLDITSGTVNLGLMTVNRTAPGGIFKMGSTGKLLLENSNFPANFLNVQLDNSSTVLYQGTTVQLVAPVTYGNLSFANGGATVKRLQAATTINGTLGIAGNATLDGDGKTITLKGTFNLATGGKFIAGDTYSEGTLVLAPIILGTKTTHYLNGTITVNNMLLETDADYEISDISGNGLTVKGDFNNQGSINGTQRKVTFEGNFINTKTLKSSGVAAFSGTREQIIQLRAPIDGNLTNSTTGKPVPPTVEFNGTVSPVLNSTAEPVFGSVLITNTGGISTSVNWTIYGELKVAGGAFHGGSYTHNIHTAITNAGIITSSGLINFEPLPMGQVSDGVPMAIFPFYMGADSTYFRSSGTIRIGGTLPVTLSGVIPSKLNNVVFANTHAYGVRTYLYGASPTALSAKIPPITGVKWRFGGNLRVETNSSFTAGPNTIYIIGGNLTNNGTISGAGGAFTLTNAVGQANTPKTPAVISGIGTTTLGNLTIETDAGIVLNKTITINGDLTYKGADFNSSGGVVRFAGTGSSLIKAPTAGTVNIADLVVEKTAAASSLKLEANLHDVSGVKVLSGTLDMVDKSIVKPAVLAGDVSQAEITVADNAFLRIGGIGTTPKLQMDKYTFAENSTVEYYNPSLTPTITDKQVVLSQQYGNLKLFNLSTKEFASGHAKIAGELTIGTEAVVVTPEIIEYNGSGAQIVAAINYKTLAISNAGTKTLAAGITGVSNTMTKAGSATLDAIANSTTVNYNGLVDQVVLPNVNYYNLTLSGSGAKTFTGTTSIAKDFTSVAGLATMEQGSIIDFNGTTPQKAAGLTYKNLRISGSDTKTLQGDAVVDESVTMVAGILSTSTHTLTLNPTANIVGETNERHISGKVKTTRTFSTTSGNSVTETQGVAQSAAVVTETFGNLGIEITPAIDPGSVTVVRETGTPIISSTTNNQSIRRNFEFTSVGTNSNLNANVVFKYFDHEVTGFDESSLRLHNLVKASDGKEEWVKHSGNAPDVNTNSLTSTGINSLTRMTLGSNVTPLPVELLSFTATKKGNNAELRWATASEQNNQGFEVQVSTDGNTYQRLGFVESRVGSSATKQEYSFTDTRSSKNGVQYYRLKQIDFDGTSKLYGPKTVNFGVVVAGVPAEVYPNPFKDKIRVNISTPTTGVATIKLYTATGRLLKTEALQVQAGINDNPLSLANTAYEPGLYLLVIELNGQQQTLKLMKE